MASEFRYDRWVSNSFLTLLQAKDRFVKLAPAVVLDLRIAVKLYCGRYGAAA
jgi:hypothetical protein